MKKSELKAMLKPLIKECIKESLLEDGILSNVIMEVTKGLATAPLVEHASVTRTRELPIPMGLGVRDKAPPIGKKLAEQKKKLMGAIGSGAYGGIDLFEGTTPAPGQTSPAQSADPLSGTDPNDAGVDISGIMAIGGNRWKHYL